MKTLRTMLLALTLLAVVSPSPALTPGPTVTRLDESKH